MRRQLNSCSLEVAAQLPVADVAAESAPLPLFRGQEALEDGLAERLADDRVPVQLLQRLAQCGGQWVGQILSLDKVRIAVLLVGGLRQRQLMADAVQPALEHRR